MPPGSLYARPQKARALLVGIQTGQMKKIPAGVMPEICLLENKQFILVTSTKN